MAVITYLSTVNSRITSRTTEGGRRRKYRLDTMRVGVTPSTNYIVPLKAKSIERFLAMEKLSANPTPNVYKDTKKDLQLIDPTEGTVVRNYIPTNHTLSKGLRFKGIDCVFLDKDFYASIPRSMATISKSTKTMVGTVNRGKDITAEPIQYTILKQLGFSELFVKNYGSRHKLIRTNNLVTLLRNLESHVSKQRRLGCVF